MNFLAHVYLSGNNSNLAIGNLIADKIKGKKVNEFPLEIQKGIYLHRYIDQFTDQHTRFRECVRELFPTYRHYSRVIVDMYFDHFLAKNWNRYHKQPLNIFAKKFYEKLEDASINFSDSIQKFVLSLIKYDWFGHYESISNLNIILSQMEKRTQFPSKLGDSTNELIKKYTYFENHFFIFFNDLIDFTKKKIYDL